MLGLSPGSVVVLSIVGSAGTSVLSSNVFFPLRCEEFHFDPRELVAILLRKGCRNTVMLVHVYRRGKPDTIVTITIIAADDECSPQFLILRLP